MKLATALKKKAALIREIKELSTKIPLSNCHTTSTIIKDGIRTAQSAVEKEDTLAMYRKLTGLKEELCSLKGRIGAANAPVFGKIALLGEYKDLILMLESTEVTVSSESNYVPAGPSATVLMTRTTTVGIDKKFKDAELLQLRDKVAKLEEELNYHNFTTEI